MPFYSIAIFSPPDPDDHEWLNPEYNLLATPDRRTADLFYRALQENPRSEGVCHFKAFERLSAQMWKFDASSPEDLRYIINAINRRETLITDPRFASLPGTIMLQENTFLAHEPLDPIMTVLPHTDLPSHVSGGEFFIRNKFQPTEYWSLFGPFVRIDLTNVGPTRFQIDLVKTPNTVGKPLMIDSDEVTITALTDLGEVPIFRGENEALLGDAPSTVGTFKFGAFKGGFAIGVKYGKVVEYHLHTNVGPTWELVM